MPIYQAGCGNCDVQRLYFYEKVAGGSPNQPSGNWNAAAGAKFACFQEGSAPSGTVPLMRMSKGDGQQRRWEFDPTTSPDYSGHHANGYVDDKPLCWVWPR
jgi:hypothetical protein